MAVTSTETNVASTFLVTLGAPDNNLMRRAVIAWLRKESGSNIIGNNPWNLRPGAASETGVPYGVRTSTSGNGQFATFTTPQDGAKAAAKLLLNAGSDWRHYDKIVSGARSGDPLKFFQGLAGSAWSSSHYGGNANSLMAIFNGISGVTGTPDPQGTNVPVTLDLGNLLGKKPTDIFTAADAQKVYDWASKQAGGLLIYPVGDLGSTHGSLHAALDALVGKTVGQAATSLGDTLGTIISGETGQVGATVDPVAGAISSIAGILGKAMGFAGGMVLIILGVFLYSKSVRTRVIQEGVPA